MSYLTFASGEQFAPAARSRIAAPRAASTGGARESGRCCRPGARCPVSPGAGGDGGGGGTGPPLLRAALKYQRRAQRCAAPRLPAPWVARKSASWALATGECPLPGHPGPLFVPVLPSAPRYPLQAVPVSPGPPVTCGALGSLVPAASVPAAYGSALPTQGLGHRQDRRQQCGTAEHL